MWLSKEIVYHVLTNLSSLLKGELIEESRAWENGEMDPLKRP